MQKKELLNICHSSSVIELTSFFVTFMLSLQYTQVTSAKN